MKWNLKEKCSFSKSVFNLGEKNEEKKDTVLYLNGVVYYLKSVCIFISEKNLTFSDLLFSVRLM